MELKIRKFTLVEKIGLKMRGLKINEISVAWNAHKDELIINEEFILLEEENQGENFLEWYFGMLIIAFSHEFFHKVLYRLEGFNTCYKFDGKVAELCDLGWYRYGERKTL